MLYYIYIFYRAILTGNYERVSAHDVHSVQFTLHNSACACMPLALFSTGNCLNQTADKQKHTKTGLYEYVYI